MQRFLIFDLNNLVNRARYGKDMRGTDLSNFAGMCMHIALDTLQYQYNRFQGGHVVACADQSSWRYDIFPEYKGNREHDEYHEIVKGLISDLCDYLQTKTNVTVLRSPKVEADDFIARWIQLHQGPDYENLIISSDNDFKQLVSSNTELYSPNTHHLYTTTGVFLDDGKQFSANDIVAMRFDREWKVVTDKKTGEALDFDPEYELVLKCIRGDTSDHIPSAYPKVRETKIRQAYEKRGGLEWNNFINSRFGPDEQFSVRERYERNRRLIDLRMIPEGVIEQMDLCIGTELLKPVRTMIPIHFRKYCERHQLIRLMERAPSFTVMLSTRYPLEQVEQSAAA